MTLTFKTILLTTALALSPLMAADHHPHQETTQQAVTLTFTKNGQPFTKEVDIDQTELSLYNNQLTGAIPACIEGLTNLQYLYLNKNQLTGGIPGSIGNLRNLKKLYLSYNQFTGTISESIGQLMNLQDLDLSDTQLTGAIPESIEKLIKLQSFNLSNNQLTGAIPERIWSMLNLQDLCLQNNQLTGAIPEGLWALPELCYLMLRGNALFGKNILTNQRKITLNTFFSARSEADGYCNITFSDEYDHFDSHFADDGAWQKQRMGRYTKFNELTPALQVVFITELANYGYEQKMVFTFPENRGTLTIHPAVNGSPRAVEASEGSHLGDLVEALNTRHMPLAEFIGATESGEHPVGLIYTPSRTKNARKITN